MPEVIEDWLSLLEQRHPDKIDLGLERVKAIAERLNLIKFSCPIITVGGTNGKGSTVASLEAIYIAAGYHVGSFTSPYFFRINEEVRINGIEIADQQLCLAFQAIEKVSADVYLTKFEIITLAALWLFHYADLDVLILEVGLGGRLDAVNVVDADVSVITNVAIDHTDWLGPDRESIGREKAGIFRSGKPVVCGDINPPVSMLNEAKALSVKWYCQNQDFNYQEREAYWEWRYASKQLDRLPKPGILLHNAATALMAIHCLQDKLPVSYHAVCQGLYNINLPGRLQKIERYQSKSILLDVAHNPAATALLSQYLKQHPIEGRNIGVIGMLADKAIADSILPLIAQIDIWYVGGLEGKRGASAEKIVEKLQTLKARECYNCGTVERAYCEAYNLCEANDRIVVFGSFYTVAKVRRLLWKQN